MRCGRSCCPDVTIPAVSLSLSPRVVVKQFQEVDEAGKQVNSALAGWKAQFGILFYCALDHPHIHLVWNAMIQLPITKLQFLSKCFHTGRLELAIDLFQRCGPMSVQLLKDSFLRLKDSHRLKEISMEQFKSSSAELPSDADAAKRWVDDICNAAQLVEKAKCGGKSNDQPSLDRMELDAENAIAKKAKISMRKSLKQNEAPKQRKSKKRQREGTRGTFIVAEEDQDQDQSPSKRARQELAARHKKQRRIVDGMDVDSDSVAESHMNDEEATRESKAEVNKLKQTIHELQARVDELEQSQLEAVMQRFPQSTLPPVQPFIVSVGHAHAQPPPVLYVVSYADFSPTDQGHMAKTGIGYLVCRTEVNVPVKKLSLSVNKNELVHQCVWKKTNALFSVERDATTGTVDIQPFETDLIVQEMLRTQPILSPYLPRSLGPAYHISIIPTTTGTRALFNVPRPASMVYAQEWIRGQQLCRVVHDVESAPLTLRAAVFGEEVWLSTLAQLGFQIVDGLHYLHRIGIVHRDLKPSNIVITSSTILKWMLKHHAITKLHHQTVMAEASLDGRPVRRAQMTEPDRLRQDAATLIVDGFAPPTSQLALPVEKSVRATAGCTARAVLIDFNSALILVDQKSVLSPTPRFYTALYAVHKWFPQVDYLETTDAATKETLNEARDRWLHFDYFALGLVLMDLFRMHSLQDDTPALEKRKDHKSGPTPNPSGQLWKDWCQKQVERKIVPSVSNFFFDQMQRTPSNTKVWSAKFLSSSYRMSVLLHQHRLRFRKFLHCMTRPYMTSKQLEHWKEQPFLGLAELSKMLNEMNEPAMDEKALVNKLQLHYQCMLHIIPGDGDCAFAAVIHQASHISLESHPNWSRLPALDSVMALREAVADHLTSPNVWLCLKETFNYQEEDRVEAQAEFEALKKKAEWTSAAADWVMGALSSILKIRIRVISSTCSDHSFDQDVSPCPIPLVASAEGYTAQWPSIHLVQTHDHWNSTTPLPHS